MSWGPHQSRAFQAISDVLNHHGLEWLILRNHQGLPDSNRSKDVDLGLEKSDFIRAEQLISNAVKNVGFTHVAIEDFQYVRCLTYFGVFDGEAESIKIDLLDGFVFRGAQLFDFATLNEKSCIYGQYRIPSKVDDAVMLWIKPLMTGGFIKEKYIPDIEEQLIGNPEAFYAVLSRVFSSAVSDHVQEVIERGDGLKSTVPLQAMLRQRAWMTSFKREPLATVRNALNHFYSEISRRIKKPTGAVFGVTTGVQSSREPFIEALCNALADLQVKERSAYQIVRLPSVTRGDGIKKRLRGTVDRARLRLKGVRGQTTLITPAADSDSAGHAEFSAKGYPSTVFGPFDPEIVFSYGIPARNGSVADSAPAVDPVDRVMVQGATGRQPSVVFVPKDMNVDEAARACMVALIPEIYTRIG